MLPSQPQRRNTQDANPKEILYIQDSISNRFQCGRRVVETMEKLRDGRLSANEIPPIRIFQWNGGWHSEDNRRLWAFKAAGLTSVPVKVIDSCAMDKRKFTTRDNGLSVKMRGH